MESELRALRNERLRSQLQMNKLQREADDGRRTVAELEEKVDVAQRALRMIQHTAEKGLP